MHIPLMKSSFYRETETKKALLGFIEGASILSMASEVRTFETRFAQWQKRKYAVMVNSGSSANLILFQGLLNAGVLKVGDRVGVSALTWATNVMPIIQLGMIPVAIDCSLATLNVSAGNLSEKIDTLQALFITNVLGFGDDLPRIRALCERKKVLFLEDNCESLGSVIQGTLLGNFSFASTFSFFIGHHLSTIEGGMVCTDDEVLYQELLMARSHGWDRQLPEQAQMELRMNFEVDDFYSKYTFYRLGFNVRPTEIQGFLGNCQLAHLDEMILRRATFFSQFNEVIAKNNHFLPLDLSHMQTVSNFAVPIVCASKELFYFYQKLFTDSGVEIRPIISGDITRQPFFKSLGSNYALPNAGVIHEQGFYFTNRPDLIPEEISVLIQLLSI